MPETTKVLDWDDPRPSDQSTFRFLKNGLRMLWELVDEVRTDVLRASGLLLLCELLALTLPLVFKVLVDHLPTIQTEGVTPYLLYVMLLMAATRSGMLFVRRFMQEPIFVRALWHLENHWPQRAQEKLLELSIGFHDRANTGQKIAKVTKGVEKLVHMVGAIFWRLLPAVFYLTLNAIILLAMDWRLGLCFIVPLIPALWIHLKSYERFQPIWDQWENMKELSVGLFCQSILNVRTVQAYVTERREVAAHSAIRNDMEHIDVESTIASERYIFAVEMIVSVSFMSTICLGFYFVHLGLSAAGTVAYFMVTGNSTLQLLGTIMDIYRELLRDILAAQRMHALLHEPVEVANEARGQVPAPGPGRLALEHVVLQHTGQAPLFSDFNLTVEQGEMLALVGKSGSGKSSLVSLLLRGADPTEGAVTIDGTNVRDVDRDWYRRRFAYVPQDVEIFDATIHANVAYASPGASNELVLQAMRAAALDEVVRDAKRFPYGLETQVGERGVRLSGGERQRVGIARAYVALLTGAQVLVLDEATSSLDSQSERVVQKFLEELRREKAITIIAIAHRLSTIREADRICVLDNGTIVEIGTHEALLRNNGLYHRLVALQSLGALRE